MLCVQCSYIFKPRYNLDGPPIDYSRKVRELETGSASCQFCAILLKWIPERDPVLRVTKSKVSAENAVMRYLLKMVEQPHYAAQGANWYLLRIAITAHSDVPIPPSFAPLRSFAFIPVSDLRPIASLPQIEESTGGSISLDPANKWLSNCLENHQLCRAYSDILDSEQDQSNHFRPTRLLEIGSSTIKLINTENYKYCYIALSHRWPANPAAILQLTTSNLSKFLDAVPLSTDGGFSKVFLDAVKVCQRLGIRYIWIDTLCIIQKGDDGEDWKRECTRMGDVYRHAVCTIAAESVEEGEDSMVTGMFRKRSKGTLAPIVGNALFDGSVYDWNRPTVIDRMRGKWKRPKPGQYYVMDVNDWHADISLSPLSRRGWVEQERVLATRILHFTSKQIFFDCYETIASEIWPERHPTYEKQWVIRPWTVLQDLALYRAGFLNDGHLTTQVKHAVENPVSCWFRIVYNYARTDLTYTSDKLVAISGLARSFRPFINATPSDYLAGIWVQSLPYGLLWYAPWRGRLDNTRIRSPETYQAPTWSWASVNSGLNTDEKFHHQEHEVLVSLEGFNIDPVLPGDPFGQVQRGARIVLKGFTHAISLTWSNAETNFKPAPKYWPIIKWGTTKYANGYGFGDLICPDERYIEGEGRDRNDLRILPVLRSKSGADTKWIIGLILEPTGTEGEYRRFGYAGVIGAGGVWWLQLTSTIGGLMTSRREEIITII